MPKEDRSDWVAVAPEFSAAQAGDKIKPALSAFNFYQRDVSDEVNAEYKAAHDGKFQVGEFTKLIRERWNQLNPDKKAYYEDLARQDKTRFLSESHAADVAAIERRERLQRERDTLLLDDEGGTKRSTRGQRAKKERKRERKEKKKLKKEQAKHKSFDADDESFQEEEEESSESFEGESDDDSDSYDSDDSDHPKKSKKKPVPRMPSQKEIERRQKLAREKKEKEAIIAERQEDVRKERAAQANRRLEFLLKQSNIFSHFGAVKQDQAKYGVSASARKSTDGAVNRRDYVDEERNDEELAEADEHQATFLTSQPTTLGFGTMRPYQLEGLNWMIRLQENGVNGILADEVCTSVFFQCGRICMLGCFLLLFCM